tara:strand:- start:3823 stop:4833 length:1011 start_codon:yes stop_codon:yes gene_type:complete
MGMKADAVRDLVSDIRSAMDDICEDEWGISERRFDAEHTGLNLLESVLMESRRWQIDEHDNLHLRHAMGVSVTLDPVGSMIMAVQDDEQHLVMSVDGHPICVAGEGIFFDVPMSDHLSTVVLLGEAGFPMSHTPDTLYMLHSPSDLLTTIEQDCFSLEERISASKLLASYTHEEEGRGTVSAKALALIETENLPPQVEIELVFSELFPKFLPSLGGRGETMVDEFVNLIVRLTRHRPDEHSNTLHRFLSVHLQSMSSRDQKAVRDRLLTLCEVSRPDLHPLFETADAVYQNTRDYEEYHALHEDIVYLPPHRRFEHFEPPANAFANANEVEDIMDF